MQDPTAHTIALNTTTKALDESESRIYIFFVALVPMSCVCSLRPASVSGNTVRFHGRSWTP